MIPGSANPLLLATAAPTGYNIERSLRFNAPDASFLSRTPASASNRKTWTWAGWVKRSNLTDQQAFWSAGSTGTNRTSVLFDGSARIRFFNYAGSVDVDLVTTPVYRDASAWYHVVISVDTTQGTSTNRLKLYINGAQVTTFSTATYPSLNQDLVFNSAIAHGIGRGEQSGGEYFSGYLADIHFIDGQALTPTSFGEFDVNNVWQPKAFSGGSYGTNGFQLKFADNSAATAAALGKDTSGNGHNWTPANLSVTAGAGNDSLVDSPTSYGTDTGAGNEVRGNYCTWNPLLRGQTGTPVYSNGNLDASATGNWAAVGGTVGIESGKWYWETTLTAAGSSNQSCIGLLKTVPTFFLGFDSGSWGYFSNGNKYTGGTASAYGSSYTANDVIGVAFDRDNGTLVFYKNGVSQGTAYTGLTSGVYFPATSHVDSSTSATNFGQRPFAYTAPSGFKALCAANLPTPTIANPATAMDVALWTGNGSARSITGLNFNPDLVWIKSRSAATDHAFYDVVRGTERRLESNNTDAEVTSDGGVTAFNSDGFSLGTLAQVNTNSATYAGWAWDAGSSTVTNTSGSISSQVRASTTNGCSVVTYTGTGANATVGHGLGVAPGLVIVKRRNVASNWQVRHTSIAAANSIQLNLQDSAAAATTVWNSTAPTSTVFSIGTDATVNANGGTYVAYCFAPVAGYSSFGSYTGNGNADGPFVFLGFRPAVLILKNTIDYAGNWVIIDDKREGYNIDNDPLYPNLANAEGTTDLVDITSNGFKVRTSTGDVINSNTHTIIYAAWASSPFAYARAR